MKKIITGLFLLTFGFVPVLGYAEIVDRVVAVVNSDVITQYDLDLSYATRLAMMRKAKLKEHEKQELRKTVLDDLVKQKLLEQEVEKSGIKVSQEELAGAIADVLRGNHITIDALRSELSAKGVLFEDYTKNMEQQLKQFKFIQENISSQVRVTDEDIKNYRGEILPRYDGESEIKLSMLFLALEEGRAKEVRKLAIKGRKIADRARHDKNFDALIQKEAEDQNRVVLQETLKLKDLPGSVGAAIPKMKVGAVSDPIVAPNGVYVIKLLDKPQSLDADKTVEDEKSIQQKLFNEKMEQEVRAYMLQLRRKAFVEIRE